MVEGKKNILEMLKGYSSTITAVMSAAVVLYGVFKFIEQGNRNTEQISDIKKQIEDIRINIPKASNDSVLLNVINLGLIQIESKVDRLTNQFTRYIAKDKSVTKEEFREIIMDIESQRSNWWDTIQTNIKIRKLK